MKAAYTQAVIEMIKSGAEPEAVLRGLDALLAHKGHERLKASVLASVARVLEARSANDTPTVFVKDEADAEKHKAAIAAALARLGASEAPRTIIDSTLVGGFVAKVHNNITDASYKTALINLYRNITK